jgi:hypothetical protein
MLQDVINDRMEQAGVTMHDYFVAKTREVTGLGSKAQVEDVVAVDEARELTKTQDASSIRVAIEESTGKRVEDMTRTELKRALAEYAADRPDDEHMGGILEFSSKWLPKLSVK